MRFYRFAVHGNKGLEDYDLIVCKNLVKLALLSGVLAVIFSYSAHTSSSWLETGLVSWTLDITAVPNR